MLNIAPINHYIPDRVAIRGTPRYFPVRVVQITLFTDCVAEPRPASAYNALLNRVAQDIRQIPGAICRALSGGGRSNLVHCGSPGMSEVRNDSKIVGTVFGQIRRIGKLD